MKPSAFRFFHDQLPSDTHRAFYEAVERAVRGRNAGITGPALPGLAIVDYYRILEYVYDDHPEFFAFYPLRSAVRCAGGTVAVDLFYRYSAAVQKRFEEELDRAMGQVLRECFPDGWAEVPELKREKLIFDWIVKNVTYDQESYQMIEDPGRLEDMSRSVAWNAYGALVIGTAVCEGIACAFKLLCNEVGLPSIVVLGKGQTGRHAWNLVRVHGKFYHVDCTWDLHGSITTQIPYARYRYFNLPDRIISANHTAETRFLPVCGSLQYNPFRMKKLCAATPEELLQIAMRMADRGHDRFAVMTWGFPAIDARDGVMMALYRYVGRNVTAYTDDSGYFIGFVIDRA